MSCWNFVISWVEHQKSFITWGLIAPLGVTRSGPEVIQLFFHAQLNWAHAAYFLLTLCNLCKYGGKQCGPRSDCSYRRQKQTIFLWLTLDKGYYVRYWQSEFFLSIQTLAHFKVCESVYDLINGVFTMHFVVPGSHIRRAIFHFFLSHHCNTKKQAIRVYSIWFFSVKLGKNFYPSVLRYVPGAQKYRLIEMVLLSTQNICSCHNICFCWELRKIIFY